MQAELQPDTCATSGCGEPATSSCAFLDAGGSLCGAGMCGRHARFIAGGATCTWHAPVALASHLAALIDFEVRELLRRRHQALDVTLAGDTAPRLRSLPSGVMGGWENSWTVLRDHSNLTRVDLRVDSGTCALSVWVDGRQVFLETPSWFQLPSAEDEWEVDAGRRLLARLAGALHPARGSARPVKAVWSRRWSRPLAAVLVLALTVWLVAAGIPFLSGSARAGQERQAAVKAYLDATASGDAGGAWRRIVIDRSTLPAGADRGLLSESGLSKLLALPENSPGPATNLKVADAGAAGQDEFVEVAYTQAGRAVAGHLRLRPDSKLGWRVVLAPALLKLSTTVDVFVDGDPAGASLVAVLPGFHRVTRLAAGPVGTQDRTVEAGAGTMTVELPDVLTPPATASAQAAVQAAFAGCLKSHSAAPAGCPQSIQAPAGSSVNWSLVGLEPAPVVADGHAWVASGHFQAIGAYPVHVPESSRHLAAAGAYSMRLLWDGRGFQPAGALAGATGLAPLSRPDLADSAVLSAAATGFQTCAAAPVLRPPDCPQSLASTLYISQVKWQLSGDPTRNAAVTFDGDREMFLVNGQFAMTVSYMNGGRPATGASQGAYQAQLFWNGSSLVLVAIAAR